MTLGVWLEKWMYLYIDPSGLAPSTKACYRRAVDAVPAELSALELNTLTALDLMPWIIGVAQKTPRAAQLDRVMLSKALKLACKLGLAPDCIIDQETLPKPQHRAKKAAVLHYEECLDYLRAAKDSDHYPLLALCLCGLRRGEALGLRWEDIQDDRLTIARQRMRVDGQYLTKDLKSDHSKRQLVLPGWLLDGLARWPRALSGWICDTTPERLHRAHKRVLACAGLPDVTIHGLRHSFATAAAERGETMKYLQVALGHAKMELTSDLYADHLDPLSHIACRLWVC